THSLLGSVAFLLLLLLELLLVSVVDRLHQRGPCLGGNGVEGVVVFGFAIFLVGLLGHGDEAPLVGLNDPDAVDGKGAADGGAGIGFGLEVPIHHTVDSRLHLGRGGFLLLFLLCCHVTNLLSFFTWMDDSFRDRRAIPAGVAPAALWPSRADAPPGECR